ATWKFCHSPFALDRLRGPLALHLINAYDGIQRHIAALDPIEGMAKPVSRRVNHQLRAVAKDELFHLDESPQLTLVDLASVKFPYFTLLVKYHTINRLGRHMAAHLSKLRYPSDSHAEPADGQEYHTHPFAQRSTGPWARAFV